MITALKNKLNVASIQNDLRVNVLAPVEMGNSSLVLPNTQNGTPVAALLAKGKVLGKSSGGCSAGTPVDAIDSNDVYFEMSALTSMISFCPEDLAKTAYAMGMAIDDNFGETELGSIAIPLCTNAISSDLLRISYLGDKSVAAAALKGGAGDVKNYNQFDGFYKQALAGVAAGSVKKVTKAIATATETIATIGAMIDLLEPNAYSDAELFVTMDFYRAISNAQSSLNHLITVESNSNGERTLFFEHVKVNPLKHVTSAAKSDFVTPPSFAMLTPKWNLQIATDVAEIEPSRVVQDIHSDVTFVKFAMQADAKIAVNKLLVVSY